MKCASCNTSAHLTVVIGEVTYVLCNSCRAKLDHPANMRDYLPPDQIIKNLARGQRRWDNTAARWRRA